MSKQQWTRAHDALIAERAEGLKVERIGQEYTYGFMGRVIEHYPTDLAAIARAQEAWHQISPNKRSFTVSRVKGVIYAECREFTPNGAKHYQASSTTTESAARAWATWFAVGGAE